MLNLNNFRHGDLCLIGIDKVPEGLKESKTNIIMKGSNNNPHIVKNGKLYLQNKGDYIIGYLEAGKKCVLLHKEHGKIIRGRTLREANIKEGVYELRCQMEHTNKSMKRVVD